MGTLDAVVNSQDDDDPPDGGVDVSPLDMDNPYGHYYNPSTAAVTFTYGFTGPGSINAGVQFWSSVSAAFIAGAVVPININATARLK